MAAAATATATRRQPALAEKKRYSKLERMMMMMKIKLFFLLMSHMSPSRSGSGGTWGGRGGGVGRHIREKFGGFGTEFACAGERRTTATGKLFLSVMLLFLLLLLSGKLSFRQFFSLLKSSTAYSGHNTTSATAGSAIEAVGRDMNLKIVWN